MTDKCKAIVGKDRTCSRRAVDRGWCKQHAIPVMYFLMDEVMVLAEAVKCPCPWGDVVSPAHSECTDETAALSCIDCDTTTDEMPLTEPEHIPALLEAWKAACEAKRVELGL